MENIEQNGNPQDNGIVDSLWQQILVDAKEIAQKEPVLVAKLEYFVMTQPDLLHAMCRRIAKALSNTEKEFQEFYSLCLDAMLADSLIVKNCAFDLCVNFERNPACDSILSPFLWFKGFLSISSYRIGHFYWEKNRKYIALYIQSRVAEKFSVDIHPAAKFGGGIFLDHATGFVAGETAVVEDNVSILHAVTLGGTGKIHGDRHPKIRSGVLIGAGAKILGNIEIGTGAKIGAGSVVLNDVAPHTTVAGVPAKVIGEVDEDAPALLMNHSLFCKR